MLRDIAEYNASFWNPEAVDQVRRAREKSIAVSDKDFAKQIEETFGRKLNIPERKEGFATPPPLAERRPKRSRMRHDVDASAYLDTELDEVRFIPIGS